MGDSEALFLAKGSSRPVVESNDSQMLCEDEPRFIVSLDPGIEDDGDSLFRDDGPLGPVPEGLSPLRDFDMEF